MTGPKGPIGLFCNLIQIDKPQTNKYKHEIIDKLHIFS